MGLNAKALLDGIQGHSNIHKGTLTEARVLVYLIDHGLIVSRPFDSNPDYDFVVQIERGHPWNRFLAIQVKSGNCSEDGRLFSFKATDNKRRTYTGRADFIAAFDNLNDRLFLVPPEELGKNGFIRLLPAKSGQRKKIKMADDYDANTVLVKLIERHKADYERLNPPPKSISDLFK